MLKINHVEFVTSVGVLHQLPKADYPEIAFAGRSNVGKSSLLNTLFGRKKMALISSTPGKTRTLNFYCINHRYHFVDCPGYGFAKVAKRESRKWRDLVEGYLVSSTRLCGVIVLIDMRHMISPMDWELIEWLQVHSIPLVVTGTKSDKLSGNKLAVNLHAHNETLERFGLSSIIPFSAVSGQGKNELLKEVKKLLEYGEGLKRD